MPRPADPQAKVKLLAAAERVFVVRGLAAAKVEEITQTAGVAKGSFYLHFSGKEDAFRELIEAMVARMAAHIEAVPDDCHRACDLHGFLDFWCKNDVQIFEFIWQNRGLMGLLFEGGQSAAYRYLVDRFADSARERVRGFLAAGVTSGLYRSDLNLNVTAAFIGGAYDRLARQVVQSRTRPNLLRILREVQSLVLRGIGSTDMLGAIAARSTRAPRGRQPKGRGTR